MTWSVAARATRANAGTVATPMAIIAVSVPAPYTAPSMTASSSAGKANTRSLTRMISSDSQPRGVIPAARPSGTPSAAAMPTATTPT